MGGSRHVGSSLKDAPELLARFLLSWRGAATVALVVVLVVALPSPLKVPVGLPVGLVLLWAGGFQRIVAERNQQAMAAATDVVDTAQAVLRIDTLLRGDAAPYPANWRSGSLDLARGTKVWTSAVSRLSRRDPITLDLETLGLTVASIRPVSREERRQVKANRFRVLECRDAHGHAVLIAVPAEVADSTRTLLLTGRPNRG